MEQLNILLSQMGIFAVLLFVGFVVRKTNLVPKSIFDSLSIFTAKLLLPLFMLTSLPSAVAGITSYTLLLLAFAFILLYAMLYLITIIGNKIQKFKGQDAAINHLVLGTTCSGFMGIPMGSGMYSDFGVAVASLYAAFDNITFWTLKYSKVSKYVKDAPTNGLQRILTPQLICIIIGVLMAAFKLNLTGNFVWETLYSIGSMAKFMGMLFLGNTIADFGKESLKFVKPLVYSITVRMIGMPLLFGALLTLIPIFSSNTSLILMMVIVAATPPMASMPSVIRSFGLDERYAAQTTIITTTISIITLPAVYYIVSLWCI